MKEAGLRRKGAPPVQVTRRRELEKVKEAGLGPRGAPSVQVTRRRRVSIGEGGWARSLGISTCPGNQEKEN